MALHFLGTKEFAEYIGRHVGTLARAKLPPPDAYIGTTRGWTKETIDAWLERRPGRGGGRQDPNWNLPPELKPRPRVKQVEQPAE